MQLSLEELELLERRVRGSRRELLALLHKITMYGYQEKVSDAIVHAVIHRDLLECNFEISRQSGKSVAYILTEAFLSVINDELYGEPIHVGFFAPKEQQVKTSFDRLKDYLPAFAQAFRMRYRESNATTLVMERPVDHNGITYYLKACTFYAYTLGEGAHVESKTLHRAYVDEAQDVDDFKVNKEVRPMLSTTGGCLFRIGVAGYKNCEFKMAIDDNRNAIVVPVHDVIKQRREVYDKTQDERHLLYEKFYHNMVKEVGGEGVDFIRTQFLLEWIVDRGNMTTRQKLETCRRENMSWGKDVEPHVVVSVDLAKKSDSTVITATTVLGQRIRAWELRGHNYNEQYPIICEVCKMLEDGEVMTRDDGTPQKFKVKLIRVDTTGSTGDAAAEALEAHPDCHWTVEYFYFAPQNKHNLYNQFLSMIEMTNSIANGTIEDTGQRRFEYWAGDPCLEQFEYQMLSMEKEYKGAAGNMLSCHHPDAAGARDDHPDSSAMGVYENPDAEGAFGYEIF